MNIDNKDKRELEKPYEAISNLSLRHLVGSLAHLFDEYSCSRMLQYLFGTLQLTNENLNLYLVILKTYQTKKFYSADEIIRHIWKAYGSGKKSPRPEEISFIRKGKKELRANIKKLMDSNLINYQLTGRKGTKRTHNTREIKPLYFSVKYKQRYPEISKDLDFNTLLNIPLTNFAESLLRSPDEWTWSEEEIINFLENYLFHNKISLLSDAQIDEFDDFLAKANYPKLREIAEDLLQRLGINKDWLLNFFDYAELQVASYTRARQIQDAKNDKREDIAQELYSTIKLTEEQETSIKQFREKVMEKQNEVSKNGKKPKV